MSEITTLFDELNILRMGQRHPPVHLWHPSRTGSIDIRIAADGRWYHEGSVIGRKALVRLFSTVLRRDPDGYCLVTPAEKLYIEVEDVPFVAIDMEVKGEGENQALLFVTNVEDYVLAGPEHPIENRGTAMRPRPYLHVRNGLEALIARPVYYRLGDLCVADGERYYLVSDGATFTVS